MPVRIGKVCIEGVDSTDDLKKHGIYYMGADLDDVIKNKIPLDYEFLVIDGSKGGIFVKASRLLSGASRWEDSEELWDAIKKELGDQDNIKKDVDTVFAWMSRIIERLPGRIIIIADKDKEPKNKPSKRESNNGEIPAWIERRVTWIPLIEKVDIKIDEGCTGSYRPLLNLQNPEKFEPRQLILSIYNSWLKKYNDGKAFEVELNFKGKQSQDISVHYIRKKAIDIKYKFLVSGITVDDGYIILPFCCPENCLKSKYPDNWAINIKNFKEKPGAKIIDLPIKRKNIKIEDFKTLLCNSICNNNKTSWDSCKDILDLCLSNNKGQKNVPYLLKRGECEEIGKSFLIKNDDGNELKFKYSRHFTLEPGKIKTDRDDEKEYVYQESLSGSASHFNMLYSIFTERNQLDKSEMYLSLVENGLTRVVIADERLAKYTSGNQIIQDVFKCAGIIVLKGLNGLFEKDLVFFECNDLDDFEKIKNNASKKRYDIFIVHQGILDKMGLEVKKLEELINEWKKVYFPFVAVTSGRGTPSNIPRNARFLPFSILESNFLTSSISKLTVVKTLFKSLARSF